MTNDLWLIGIAWLATYLVHSTLFLLGTWLIMRWRLVRSDGPQETLWRLALVGGVVTATIQVALQVEPAGGSVTLATVTSSEPRRDASPAVMSPVDRSPRASAPSARRGPESAAGAVAAGKDLSPAAWASPRDEDIASGTLPQVVPTTSPTPEGMWRLIRWLGATVLTISALLLGWTAVSWRRFTRRLADRTAIESGPAVATLRRLQRRAGMRRTVRLTCSERLASPIAFGIVHPEICLPRRVVAELTPAEQACILAHELAHLARRDPAWMTLGQIIERLLFLQPLNRIARRRLQELAEYRCDAWAVAQTGDRLALARCLANVAEWIVEQRRAPVAVRASAMAGAPRALRQRVGRLLAEPPAGPAQAGRRWGAAVAAAALLSVALAAPGVRAGHRTEEPSRSSLSDGGNAPVREIEPVAPRQAGPVDELALLLDDLDALDAALARLRDAAGDTPGLDEEVAGTVRALEVRAAELRRRRTLLAVRAGRAEAPDAERRPPPVRMTPPGVPARRDRN